MGLGFRVLDFGYEIEGLGFERSEVLQVHMGGCQNYGPFSGTLDIRCRIIIGTPKGTVILTTTHIASGLGVEKDGNYSVIEGVLVAGRKLP